MAPRAVALGLSAELKAERPGLPVRAALQDALLSRDTLLQVTKWQSLTPGHNCDTADWLAIQHVHTYNLWQ